MRQQGGMELPVGETALRGADGMASHAGQRRRHLRKLGLVAAAGGKGGDFRFDDAAQFEQAGEMGVAGSPLKIQDSTSGIEQMPARHRADPRAQLGLGGDQPLATRMRTASR